MIERVRFKSLINLLFGGITVLLVGVLFVEVVFGWKKVFVVSEVRLVIHLLNSVSGVLASAPIS